MELLQLLEALVSAAGLSMGPSLAYACYTSMPSAPVGWRMSPGSFLAATTSGRRLHIAVGTAGTGLGTCS